MIFVFKNLIKYLGYRRRNKYRRKGSYGLSLDRKGDYGYSPSVCFLGTKESELSMTSTHCE